jgi:membrane protease YdiL (CAAX protease family)
MARFNAAFLPHQRISVQTAIWALVLGTGLVAPLIFVIACLPLPKVPHGGAAQQARYMGYVAHPGALFFKAGIIFPLLEEIFYRGLILQILWRYSSLWLAVVFSAAFFGVTHLGQGYATALNAFVLGCLFAWLVVQSRSLYPSMLCHSAFNCSWLFVIGPAFGLTEKILKHEGTSSLTPLEIFPVWWLVVSIGLLATALIMLTKQFSETEVMTAVELKANDH